MSPRRSVSDRFARNRVFPKLTLLVAVLSISILMQSGAQAAGVWTKLKNSAPGGGCGAMALLTDGTIMVQGPNVSKLWFKLTPDANGDFTNGTWSSLASMSLERLFFGSNILPSGKYFVLGGEYSGPLGQQNITNTGEIYDPVADKWTSIPSFPQPEFGDDPTVVLPNGKVLCGYIFDGSTYLFNPLNNSWQRTGTKLRGDRSDEETWLLLPGGRVLSYDVFSSVTLNQGHAQIYNSFSGQWTDAGNVPVILSDDTFGFELGPGSLLPDGRVIQVGANNKIALYNPKFNTWTAGPSLPANIGGDDSPGCMLPNGHFIFFVDTSVPIFTPPTRLFDFDYTSNSITEITPTTGPAPLFTSSDAFPFRVIMLPNGHMLMGHRDTPDVWDYAPDGNPLPQWAPTVVSVTKIGTSSSTSYLLTGTQLTGISEGATYGDDLEMSTNYPIVRLKNSKGAIITTRTSNWTPGVATGSLRTTVQFDVPKGLPNDLYQLTVSANGISSQPFNFRIGPPVTPSNVTAVYSAGSKTLTLTGDTNANSLTVSLQAGVLKVEGANGTKINSTTSFSTAHAGKLVLIANMNDGDDALSIIGVDSSTTNLNLGAGNDKAAITLSHIQSLTVNGGAGVDTVLTTSSTIGATAQSQIP